MGLDGEITVGAIADLVAIAALSVQPAIATGERRDAPTQRGNLRLHQTELPTDSVDDVIESSKKNLGLITSGPATLSYSAGGERQALLAKPSRRVRKVAG